MNTQKLNSNRLGLGFPENENSRFAQSKHHNYSRSQNLTNIRPPQVDRSLKSSFKENRPGSYRMTPLVFTPNPSKIDKRDFRVPVLASKLFQMEKPSKLSDVHAYHSAGSTRITNRLEKSESITAQPKATRIAPSKGFFRRNFKARFQISHDRWEGRFRQSLDSHEQRQETVLRAERNVESSVCLEVFLPKKVSNQC